MLRRHYPQVRFIQSSKNLGFAKANNVAFYHSRGKTVLFLNPDTLLVEPAINILYDRLNSLPVAGVVGCKLLNSDSSVQKSCIMAMPTILNQVLDSEYLRGRWPNSSLWGTRPLQILSSHPAEVEAISGACMMVKRSVFEKVGFFSEDYFMYTEDIDLCHKVRKAGYRNYYVPNISVIHFGGGSSEKGPNNFSVVMMQESIWRFLLKTRGPTYAFCYRGLILLSGYLRIAVVFAAAYPLSIAGLENSPCDRSLEKWRAIIRWCMNKETWVKKYR